MRITKPGSIAPYRTGHRKCLIYGWLRIAPATVARDDLISLSGPPGIRVVLMDWCYVPQNRIDDTPRSFYAIFTYEQGRVTSDGIAEQTLVWRHLISGGLSYDEFHTVANHRFSGHLGPRTQGDGYIRAETKAKVVRLTLVNGVEHSLGRTLKVNQHFGCADRHSLSGSNVEWNTCPSPCVGVEPDRGERL